MDKAEEMKNLKNGKGLQYLLDEGHKILGNPMNIFDTDYKLIAYTDVSTDDRFWNELITTGTFSIEAQMFFMNECFTDEVANAEKLAVMKSDKLKYDRILGHIFNGDGIKVANVLMLECSRAFDPDTVAAFEVLADLLTKEIRNDEFYIRYGEMYQNAWIKKLINNDIDKKGLYSSHVQILYNDFKTYLYVGVVDIARSMEQHNDHEYFLDLFRQRRKDFKYAVYDDHIVMVMSTDYRTFDEKRELLDLAGYIEEEKIAVGISSCFENLFELQKYYNEALSALNSGRENTRQSIFFPSPI